MVEARVAKKLVLVEFVLVLLLLNRLVKVACVPVSVLIEPVFADTPPANVLVPCPAPTVIAAANVEVADVLVAFMTLNWPREPKWLTAKRLVVEALVPVALTKVKFCSDDWPPTPVVVAKKEPEYRVVPVAAMVFALVQYAIEPIAPPPRGAW